MLKIVMSPDPLLNKVSEPCDPTDPSLRELAEQMIEAMYENNGVGLAAVQVGVLKRLIVVDCNPSDEPDPIALVNPEIIELDGEPVTDMEGCLSCPGIDVPIERRPWARVRYCDFDGQAWEIASDGLLGRCLQHEIDHLNGITLFEAAKPRDRIHALSAYAEAQRTGADGNAKQSEAKVR